MSVVRVPVAERSCSQRATLPERIRCRLELSLEGIVAELSVPSIPEECRAMGDASARASCIDRNEQLRPCRELPAGSDRATCVREVLGIPDFQTFLPKRHLPPCATEDAQFTKRCEERFRRERAYPSITFRFQELAERAESFRQFDVSLDAIVRFVTLAEQATIDFNAATTKTERVAIIRRVRDAWRTFVSGLPDTVKDRIRRDHVQ